jgi:hypothetical protein
MFSRSLARAAGMQWRGSIADSHIEEAGTTLATLFGIASLEMAVVEE